MSEVPVDSVPAERPRFTEVTLPSGKVARIRRGKGRDIKAATRLVGDVSKEGLISVVFAHVAVKCTIDGQPIAIEDIDDMDEEDVFVLMGHALGKVLWSLLTTSQPSSPKAT